MMYVSECRGLEQKVKYNRDENTRHGLGCDLN